MKKYPIIGSFWASGASGYAYRQGWRFHVNSGGNPNCIWRTIGDEKVPVMCHPWYGVSADGEPALDTDESLTKACYWTSRTVLRYFRFLSTSTARTKATTGNVFGFFPHFPTDKIEWPVGLELAVEETSGDDRKAKEMVYDGMNILQATEQVLNEAGPYSLFLSPDPPEEEETGAWKSKLCIVRTRYDDADGSGVLLNRPVSGNAATVLAKPKVVLGGQLSESSANLFTRVAIGGDLCFIETSVYTTPGGTGWLQEAWDSDTETAFNTFIQTRYNAGDSIEDATRKACRKYPHVGAAFRLDHDFMTTLIAGSQQAGHPAASVPRPVLPHLLSSYIESAASSPSDDEKRRFRRPVLFEYQDSADDVSTDPWFLAEESDGLAVDADGTIWVPALRDNSTTIEVSTSGTVPSATVSLEVRKLRCTLAVPCDHRYVKSQKLAMDEADVEAGAIQSADAHRIKSGLNWLYYADTPELYGFEERYQAWPIPETVDGSAQQTDTIRDDGDLLQSHVDRRMRDYGRLDRAGILVVPNMMTTIRPGMMIRGLDNSGGDDDDESSIYNLNVAVVAVSWVNRKQDGARTDGTPSQFVSVDCR